LMKIGLIGFVFFFWVRLSDWINRDAVQLGDLTGHRAEVWNPINLALHLAGFFAAISIPIFWIGYPIYVLCAFLPYMIYWFVRRSRIKKDSSIGQRLNPDEGLVMEELQQDLGAAVDFTPAGETDADRQANLIRARQSSGFVVLKDLLCEVLLKRACLDRLLTNTSHSAHPC